MHYSQLGVEWITKSIHITVLCGHGSGYFFARSQAGKLQPIIGCNIGLNQDKVLYIYFYPE